MKITKSVTADFFEDRGVKKVRVNVICPGMLRAFIRPVYSGGLEE